MNRRGLVVWLGFFVWRWTTTFAALQFDLGKKYGLDLSNPNAPMHEGALRQIMTGVHQEKPEAMYLFGLMQYYGHGVTRDKEAAVRFFRKAAAERHLEAQFTLGLLHHTGDGGREKRQDRANEFVPVVGIDQDDSIAYSLLNAAANRGHADSQWLLGTMLQEGRGTTANMARALEVDQTHVIVFDILVGRSKSFKDSTGHALGVFYEYGRAVPQNLTLAAQLYAEAAAENVAEGAFYLGLMHAYGRGFPQDFESAFGLFKKAADWGHGPAMYYLGLMHTHGQGVEINYDQALYWFQKAGLTRDPSIEEQATRAARELKDLLVQVTERRRAVMSMPVT
ncbi:unnamed protein product [Aphanomyces euteiches]